MVTIEMPQTGYYRLAIKYRQSFLSVMTANSKLLLDGFRKLLTKF